MGDGRVGVFLSNLEFLKTPPLYKLMFYYLNHQRMCIKEASVTEVLMVTVVGHGKETRIVKVGSKTTGVALEEIVVDFKEGLEAETKGSQIDSMTRITDLEEERSADMLKGSQLLTDRQMILTANRINTHRGNISRATCAINGVMGSMVHAITLQQLDLRTYRSRDPR